MHNYVETSPLIISSSKRSCTWNIVLSATVSVFSILAIIISILKYLNGGDASSASSSIRPSSTCDPKANLHSGYISILPASKYFYSFLESEVSPATDPLVLWLSGGPGASSLYAMLDENGPCVMSRNSTSSFQQNPYSWNKAGATILWLDQPTNVGFSYGNSTETSLEQVGKNIFLFLQKFVTSKQPAFINRDLYITGESFAGHYIPAASQFILQHQKEFTLRLKGIVIGNGLTNPYVQKQHSLDLLAHNAYNITLVRENTYNNLVENLPTCLEEIQECQNTASPSEVISSHLKCATSECMELPMMIIKDSGRNPQDIRQLITGSTISSRMAGITTFLNTPEVQQTLGVHRPWTLLNRNVTLSLSPDGTRINSANKIPELLEAGIRVLVYAGDADTVCNWIGNEAWTKVLKWSGANEYNAMTPLSWKLTNGKEVGRIRTSVDGRRLSFVRILNSGHMSPRDQPKVLFKLIHHFLHSKGHIQNIL